jgi:hypothetical protein
MKEYGSKIIIMIHSQELGQGLFIPQLRMCDFPNHASSQIRNVALGETKFLHAARYGFQKLAREDPTIEPILLLGQILEKA